MAEMNAAFFEEAKYNLQHGKINFLNVAGLIPEVTEERHVVVRLPANSMHLMPIITPPSRSGWTRTARAGARKTTPTMITRENVYESDFYENG